ncbi:MAG: aromatase/cyclase [Actinomycetota bacterium]|nr:aromatase/cyclase [Actinomycetota bacterium]
MPYVETSIVIKGDRGDVYRLARDMERYPKFMRDVKSVKVIKRDGNATITEWETDVEDVSISWREREEFDDENMRIKYRLIEGDLDKFEGEWIFKELPDGTEIILTVDFDFGMPTLAELIGPVLEMKVKENSRMMLEGIKERIEGC